MSAPVVHDWARLGVLGHEEALRPWIAYHENLTARWLRCVARSLRKSSR